MNEDRLTLKGIREEQREAMHRRLDTFVHAHPNFFLTTLQSPGGNILVIAKKDSVSSKEAVAHTLTSALKYQREHVQNAGYSVGECAKIARDAVTHFKSSFPKWSTLSVEGPQGSVLPFFKEHGFRNHVVNYISDGSAYVAVDLNAGVHMDKEKGEYTLFAMIADSREEAEKMLGRLYMTV